MPHQDSDHLRKNLQAIEGLIQCLVPENVAAFTRHGNSTLDADWLAAVALICFGWTDGPLHDRVHTACSAIGRVWNVSTTVTRQGLLKALASCGQALVERTANQFPQMLAAFRGQWTRGGKVNIAVDGTKLSAPRTPDNQAAFSAAHSSRRKRRHTSRANASKAATVQLLATVFWHLGTGLPLRWKLAGSTGSERQSVVGLLDQLPAHARLIGDAEYVGYPLWSAIINSKRSFLFRVGSNITLLKHLGGKFRWQGGYVHFWPQQAQQQGQPPITLRLFIIHNGRQPIYLVTNELDMTDTLAWELYAGRWGIEVFFRSVKQTWQRSKLVCGSPSNALVELNWTLLGIWSAMFLAKQALDAEGVPLQRMSAAKVLRACLRAIQGIVLGGRDSPQLAAQLTAAVIADESARTTSKKNRNYPRKKKHEPCGPPKIMSATHQQQQAAKEFLN